MVEARPGVPARDLWVRLGELAALVMAGPVLWLSWCSGAERTMGLLHVTNRPYQGNKTAGSAGIVICYGLFGFGYILPATFLPAMAREVVDDPAVFGLAWPIFGGAAALSTIVVAPLFDRVDRLRVWASSHLVMAAGVVLPTIWLSKEAVTVAALLVGGTFMVITMLGLQEGSARAPDNPTAILGRMTAAFAIGQLAGPLASVGFEQVAGQTRRRPECGLVAGRTRSGGQRCRALPVRTYLTKGKEHDLGQIKPDPDRVNDPARL
jgi:predicted MFS family arabinose efflux permease